MGSYALEKPLPPRVGDYRVELRGKALGNAYRGWLHFSFTSLASLSVIAFALTRLQHVHWAELITIPATFLVANAVEYFAHKGPMHRPAKGLKVIFERHTVEHHHFFTHESMPCEGSRDFKFILFPPEMLLFFLGGIATPIGVAVFWLATPNAGWLFVATALSYFVSYEWLHLSYHLPDSHPVARLPLIRSLRRHHTEHHDVSLMSRFNFNITYPIFDRWMGTHYGVLQKRRAKAAAKEEAPRPTA